MGANLQMVFYKSAKKGNPILVKFLYNESEVTVPVVCAAKNSAQRLLIIVMRMFEIFYNAIISKNGPIVLEMAFSLRCYKMFRKVKK